MNKNPIRIAALVLLPLLFLLFACLEGYHLIFSHPKNLHEILSLQLQVSYAWMILDWTALLLLFYFGTFRSYKYCWIAIIGVVFNVVGRYMMASHWPGAFETVFVGNILLLTIYNAYFWKKKIDKSIFDWFKYGLVTLIGIIPIIHRLIHPDFFVIQQIERGFSLVVFVMFYNHLWKNESKIKFPELETSGDSIFSANSNHPTI